MTRLSGDQLQALHNLAVLECVPELRAAYDASRPERVAFIIEVRGTIEARIGIGDRDDLVSDLLDLADAGGATGIKELAAELLAGPLAAPGRFFCVVIMGGLAACYEFDLALLTGQD